MRARVLIAILVGTVLAFGWGAVSWTSGLYDAAFKPLPGGGEIAAQIDAATAGGDGAFIHPAPPQVADLNDQQRAIAQDAYAAEHRKGPLVMALVRRQGVDPMSANVLVRGFVLEFFCVSLLAAVMALAARYGMRVQHRLVLAVFIPLFAVMGTHAVDWNFLHLPDGYAIALFVDGLVAWLLAGVACALIISPRKD
ncbi:MAG: hypothetical protein ACOYO7_07875 [Phycisphaerales bacterium]|jgi:hypothetical protein